MYWRNLILVTAVDAWECDLEDFSDYKWTCPCCGEEQIGLPQNLHFEFPNNWPGVKFPNTLFSFLNSDFCKIRRIGKPVERYILALLPLPIIGSDQTFDFGVWMSVSKRSWAIYEKGFETEVYDEPNCFGWLMHELPKFPSTISLPCTIEFRDDRLRPMVWVHETDHPLYEAQQEGVNLDYIKGLMAKFHERWGWCGRSFRSQMGLSLLRERAGWVWLLGASWIVELIDLSAVFTSL